MRFLQLLAVRLTLGLTAVVAGTVAAPAAEPQRFEFTRMVAHWAQYGGDDFLTFVEEARPELAQHGFYGAHFWSLSHTPQYAGYPAHFPVRGIAECGKWFRERNAALHKRGVKVVGHFNVEFLVGDPDGPQGPRGFFRFYRDLWDPKQLGPKPVQDPLQLLEKDARGKPITQKGYSIGGMREYWACLRNPAWQKVLKAWVRVGVQHGLDGFIANYFYRHNCLCQHCQREFRGYLAKRHTAEQLKQRFGIADLPNHTFKEIVSWHAPRETSPLRLEMLRWSQISNKRVFDEVFIKYGRSLKPDLLAAQWNHLGNFGQISGDERCLLPDPLWGRGEDYLWYSTGGAAYYTDLKKRYLGEGTLQARYIRGAFDDKPFTLGKYENTRIRVAISELAANGGAPMGFYTRFTDPAARKEIVRYYGFLRKHDALFHANRPHAEVLLLFPRSRIHRGDIESVQRFRRVGTRLLDQHVLFDILPDGRASETVRKKYRQVIDGGAAEPVAVTTDGLSRFKAPFTVRVSASRPQAGRELTLHLVNYDREEPPRSSNGRPSAGRGIVDEKPRPVDGVQVDLRLPQGAEVAAVTALTPESPKPQAVAFQQQGDRVRFRAPRFLVYNVLRVQLK